MSYCQYLIHGFSAVSEAVMYMNYPTLHEQRHGINIEREVIMQEYNKQIQYTNKRKNKSHRHRNNTNYDDAKMYSVLNFRTLLRQ